MAKKKTKETAEGCIRVAARFDIWKFLLLPEVSCTDNYCITKWMYNEYIVVTCKNLPFSTENIFHVLKSIFRAKRYPKYYQRSKELIV